MEDVLAALAGLVPDIAAITGAQADGMTRDDGWRLLTIGRQIERLVSMGEVLVAYFEHKAVLNESGFDQLLALFNSTITYRSRYQGQRDLAALIDLLVLDAANPRSLACAAATIARELALLSEATGHAFAWAEAGYFLRSRELLLVELCRRDPQDRYVNLLERARALVAAARSLSNRLGLRYFSHSEPLRSQIV